MCLAVGRTDMRRGMNSLALQVQETLQRDPHAGDLYVFRGRRGDLIKIFWHDGLGMSLYAKRLERGRFIWPAPVDARPRTQMKKKWRGFIRRPPLLLEGLLAAQISRRRNLLADSHMCMCGSMRSGRKIIHLFQCKVCDRQ